jgi:hypothetical protein
VVDWEWLLHAVVHNCKWLHSLCMTKEWTLFVLNNLLGSYSFIIFLFTICITLTCSIWYMYLYIRYWND